jgi:NitT/TauT family transport system substrate-binding protein
MGKGATPIKQTRRREAGMVKASPNMIIAESTDWRFLNELKRELKS